MHRVIAGVFLALVPGALVWSQVTSSPRVLAERDAGDVVLAWQGVPNATGYNIYRSDDLSRPFQLIGQSPVGSFRDGGAAAGPPDHWYYLVHGTDALGEGPSSNMAFRFLFPLRQTGPDSWEEVVSLPWLFVIGGQPPDAQEFCAANPGLQYVRRTMGRCGESFLLLCRVPLFNFEMKPGEGYWVSSPTPLTLVIVGSHDPDYLPGLGSSSVLIEACPDCSGPGLSVVSLPYHATAITAEELCQQLAAAGTPIDAVQTFLVEEARYVDHFCGTPVKDFPLVRGLGYGLLTSADAAWQPEVLP